MRFVQGLNRVIARTLLTAMLSLVLILTVPLSGCLPAPAANSSQTSTVQIPADLSFDELAEQLFIHEVSIDTLTLNQLVANPQQLGIEVPDPTFGDFSHDAYVKDDQYYKALLEALGAVKVKELTPEQQVIYKQIESALQVTLELEKAYYYLEPLKPSTGTQAELPLTLTEFNFRSPEDIDLYIALLNDMPRYFDQLIAHEQEKQKQNLLMSSEAMDDVLTETKGFIVEPEKHILVTSFEQKLSSDKQPFASLTAAQKQAYQSQNLDAVDKSVIPAYQQLYDALSEIAKSCKSGTNFSSYPHGREYYQMQMQATGFAQTPSQAIETLDIALDDLWDLVAYSSVPLDKSEQNLQKAVGLLADSPEAILAFLEENYASEFPSIDSIDYQVKQAPEETPSDFALAFYIIPPVDNTEANTIYYYPDNISDKASLYTTLAHEGIPGHMYQTNFLDQNKATNIQKLLMNLAFMEGWARYAENISLGFLDISKPSAEGYAAYNNFMYGLHARVDLGVNFDGWDLRETQNYLAQWNMQAAAADLFDTAIKQPMAYLPYGLGAIEFNQLRQRAEQQLGDDFDPVSFHQQLLEAGAVPFEMLEARFENWLKTNGASKTSS